MFRAIGSLGGKWTIISTYQLEVGLYSHAIHLLSLGLIPAHSTGVRFWKGWVFQEDGAMVH